MRLVQSMIFSRNFGFYIYAILAFCLISCSAPDESEPLLTETYFFGKWKSSKLNSPICFDSHNEWEIKKFNGDIYQYGMWHYENKKLTWTYKIGEGFYTDVDEVILIDKDSFLLREADRTLTKFYRLGDIVDTCSITK